MDIHPPFTSYETTTGPRRLATISPERCNLSIPHSIPLPHVLEMSLQLRNSVWQTPRVNVLALLTFLLAFPNCAVALHITECYAHYHHLLCTQIWVSVIFPRLSWTERSCSGRRLRWGPLLLHGVLALPAMLPDSAPVWVCGCLQTCPHVHYKVPPTRLAIVATIHCELHRLSTICENMPYRSQQVFKRQLTV